MTTSFNLDDIKQMLDDSGIDYSLNSDTPGIAYEDGTFQTFDQALESFRQQFIYPERNNLWFSMKFSIMMNGTPRTRINVKPFYPQPATPPIGS